MAVAGLALVAVNAPETMAQEATGVEISRTSTLQVTGVTMTTDGEYNFKNFEVEAPEAGSYDAGVLTQYKPSGRSCHKRPDREWSRVRENSCQLKTNNAWRHRRYRMPPCNK